MNNSNVRKNVETKNSTGIRFVKVALDPLKTPTPNSELSKKIPIKGLLQKIQTTLFIVFQHNE